MGPEETIGLKEPANENTLLQKQMFPRLRPHETFVWEAIVASREAKMFLNFFRNTLLPQLFLRLRAKETFRETLYPRMWAPLRLVLRNSCVFIHPVICSSCPVSQVISAQQLPKPADTKGESRTKGEVRNDTRVYGCLH